MTFVKKINREFKIGLLATTALIILYLGSEFLKGSRIFSSQHLYYATYAHSKGLSTSSPVLVNGKAVGKVKQIEILPDQGHQILVTLEIRKDIKPTDTTTAMLVSPNVFGIGGKAIALHIGEGAPLQNGSTILGKIEQGPADFFTENVLLDMDGNQDPALLAGQLMTKLTEYMDKTDKIFSSVENTTHVLNKAVRNNYQNINTISRQLAEVSSVLSDSKHGVRPLLTTLNKVTEGLEHQKTAEILQRLNNALAHLEKVFDTTEHDNNLYNKLHQSLEHLDQLLVDLKKNPNRYVNLSLFGK